MGILYHILHNIARWRGTISYYFSYYFCRTFTATLLYYFLSYFYCTFVLLLDRDVIESAQHDHNEIVVVLDLPLGIGKSPFAASGNDVASAREWRWCEVDILPVGDGKSRRAVVLEVGG